MVRYSDMTRPVGKPIKSDSIADIMSKEESNTSPNTTIKYKIYQTLKNNKKSFTVNQVQLKLKMMNSRKVFERSLLDLYRSGLIQRERCICGSAYIYKK